MSNVMNVETIKQEAEASKKSLEKRRDKTPPMSQRITVTVPFLLEKCYRTLFLCKQIEVLQDELRTTKLKMQRIKEMLEA